MIEDPVVAGGAVLMGTSLVVVVHAVVVAVTVKRFPAVASCSLENRVATELAELTSLTAVAVVVAISPTVVVVADVTVLSAAVAVAVAALHADVAAVVRQVRVWRSMLRSGSLTWSVLRLWICTASVLGTLRSIPSESGCRPFLTILSLFQDHFYKVPYPNYHDHCSYPSWSMIEVSAYSPSDSLLHSAAYRIRPDPPYRALPDLTPSPR